MRLSILAISTAFTLGALFACVKYERKITAQQLHYERTISEMKIEQAHVTEDSYHEGESDGYNTGLAECRRRK
jgi:hypothetical protein